MTSPLDATASSSSADLEAVLRTQLHRLADHAPTNVRAFDEIVAGPVVRRRRDRRRVAGVGGTIAILAAAFGVTTLAVSSTDDGGAATPEEAVIRLVDAVESEDVLSVLDIVDPAEVGALRAALVQAESDAKRLELVDESFRLDGIAGIDIQADGLQYATNDLTSDLATVTATAGTLTTTIDPAAFPFGDVLHESADDGASTSTVDLAADGSGWATLATVRRDGRWYVSVSFTIAERARRDAEVDLPSAAGIAPEGFTSPEEAATALFDRLLAGNLAGAIATAAPGEGDALAWYASLWLPSAQPVLDEQLAAGWSLTLHDPTFEVSGEGDRRMLRPSTYVIAGTVPAGWDLVGGRRLDPTIDTIVWTSDGTGYVTIPAGQPVPATLDGLTVHEFEQVPSDDVNVTFEQPDGSIEPHLFTSDADDRPFEIRVERRDGCTTFDAGANRVFILGSFGTADHEPASADGSTRACSSTSLLGLIWLAGGGEANLPAVATVQVGGQWYVSPLGTAAAAVTELLHDVQSSDDLFDSPIAWLIYGTSRADLENLLVGSPTAQVPTDCAELVVAEGVTITAIIPKPTVSQARACYGALTSGEWTTYHFEGSESGSSEDPAIDSVPATSVEVTPATLDSVPPTVTG